MFTAEENAQGAFVAVLSHGLWQRRWGGDTAIVGRVLNLNGSPFTVVGILPAGFRPPEALGQQGTDLWMPLSHVETTLKTQRFDTFLVGIGRLASGVTPEATQAELDVLGEQIREEFPADSGRHRFGLRSLHQQTVGRISTTLTPLVGAVGLLLLIACANVANLLLVGASERGREFALRSAIGAGRGRIVRQLLTESLMLGALGGVGGIGVAWVEVAAFVAFNPGDVPRLGEVGVDSTVLTFAVLTSLITSLAFGLAPAAAASRADIVGALKVGTRGSGASVRYERLRNGIVVAETSLAILLVVAAGLLINSFVRLNRVDTGFEPDNVYAMSVSYPDATSPDQLSAFYGERIEGLPGVGRPAPPPPCL